MKQEKSSNKPPGGGDQKVLVNVKYALYSLIMVVPTKEWGEPTSPGTMFCQTSTQRVLQTESINNNIKKFNSSIMQVRNNILAVAEEAGKIHCNTEVTHTNKIGDLPGYSDPVWYNPKCGS